MLDAGHWKWPDLTILNLWFIFYEPGPCPRSINVMDIIMNPKYNALALITVEEKGIVSTLFHTSILITAHHGPLPIH